MTFFPDDGPHEPWWLEALANGWAENIRMRIEAATRALVPRASLDPMMWQRTQRELIRMEQAAYA